MIGGDIDARSESKLNNNFAGGQFLSEGYGVPFQINRHNSGGGIVLFARSDTTDQSLSTDSGFESFFDELNFRKKEIDIKLFL